MILSRRINETGYFDIVIGNPPYGAKLENVKRYKNLFPETSIGNIDSYKYFIHKGLNLILNSGSLCYITSDSYLEKEYFTDLRNYIIKRSYKIKNIKLGDNVFENVNLPTAILLVKRSNTCQISYSDVSMHGVDKKIEMIDKSNICFPYSTNFTGKRSFFKIQNYNELIELYDQVMGVKVYQVGKGKPKQTKFEIENNSFISDVKIGNEWLPFIDSGIKRYEYNSKVKYIKYGEWLAEPRDIKFFKNPKVLIREVVNPRIFSCYVESECIVKNTAAVVIQKLPQYDLMFLLGLLNSKFFNYYILTQSPKSNNKTFPSITSALIKQFKIPSDCESSCKKISNIVSEILNSKELKKDILLYQFDAKIDYIVYKMYDLTYEEVKFIDSEFSLSENEYKNLRLN